MKKTTKGLTAAALLALASLGYARTPLARTPTKAIDPFWHNAVVYFLMTDRFHNGDPSNDLSYGRKKDSNLLRGFEGGDVKGVTQKIQSGYFNELGVNAIWTTPVLENVHAPVSEKEWGKTYAYHGYWPKDWTAFDANFGTEADFKAMVKAAHSKGMYVLVDVIINHSGVATEIDPEWPDTWVRKSPTCDYSNYAMNTSCLLSFTLQDILTESEKPVELPDFLLAKWKKEGRADREMAELDAFFQRTQLPRAPKYYIVKWLADWVREYGVDGFRVDTAKHVDPEIWTIVKREAEYALLEWRKNNPNRPHADRPFYMTGEVFNYGLLGFSAASDTTLDYEFGDRNVNYYDFGFDSLINMGFPSHAKFGYRELFAKYDQELQGRFAGKGVLSYISSHDDMAPFDPKRERAEESAVKLLLAPGAAQIYYGDEIGRSLAIAGTKGDETLRSTMDWTTIKSKRTRKLLTHWQTLAKFRSRHVAVGAGKHHEIQASGPFVFARTFAGNDASDTVVVALDVKPGSISIPVKGFFDDGEKLIDAYSGQKVSVRGGSVRMKTRHNIVLLEARK